MTRSPMERDANASPLDRLETENRRLKRALVGCFLLAVFVGLTAFRWQQAPEAITIAGKSFSLGMTKADALAKVNECCAQLVADSSAVEIRSKGGPPIEDLGTIFFAGDRVTAVRRYIDQFQTEDSLKVGLSIYRAILAITHSQPASITLQVQTQELQGGTTDRVLLVFPTGRQLVLDTSRLDPNPSKISSAVSLAEELVKPK